jgi:hypothetical protein
VKSISTYKTIALLTRTSDVDYRAYRFASGCADTAMAGASEWRLQLRSPRTLSSAEPGDRRSDLASASRAWIEVRHLSRRQAAEVPAERWRGQRGQHFDDRHVLWRPASLARRIGPWFWPLRTRLISELTSSQSGCLSLLLAALLSEAGIGAQRDPRQGWGELGLGEAATELAHGLCEWCPRIELNRALQGAPCGTAPVLIEGRQGIWVEGQ